MLESTSGSSAAAQNEANLWQIIIQQLNGAANISGQNDNTIMVPQAFPCSFGDTDPAANYQLYQIGNTIPQWNLTWGGFNGNFFPFYESFVNQVHPQPQSSATSAQIKQLSQLQSAIASLNNQVNAIKMDQYKNYIKNNCLTPDPSNPTVCKQWMQGSGPQGFANSFAQYMKTSMYQNQVQTLENTGGQTLAGLQSEYNALAQQVYGPNFQQIAEAQEAVSAADPLGSSSNKKYQMQVSENGNMSYVPLFTSSPDFSDFKTWLKNAKAGKGTKVSFTASQSTNTKSSSSFQLSGGGGVPVADIFMMSGNGSYTSNQYYASKYAFTMNVSYESILNVQISPSSTWFNSSILESYVNYSFAQGSNFVGKTLWGPQGIMNLLITGVLVAYRPSVTITSASWSEFKQASSWSESADVSILGILPVGNEQSGGSSSSKNVTQSANGCTITDNSGVPKIIAVYVQPINYALTQS